MRASVNTDGAGAEVQRPRAFVVNGGLLSSTFLKLVLLPVLYEWVEKKQQPDGRRNLATARHAC